jgi:transposase InsO family protein
MTEHDVLVGFRVRLFTLADELGNVSAACRAMGVDRSTYYRLKQRVDRWGLEALNVRERRRPRMPNQIGPHLEQRIIAFALGHPGYGPRRISAELAREKWGGVRISEHGVWRVLRRVRLNTRAKRLALIARHRDPYERKPNPPPPERHIDASVPGEKVQLDCFYVGRLSGTKGTVWQYTAIDVASSFCWAELHATERNPRSRHTRELHHRVAAELAAAGWKLQEVTTDNGSEFRANDFGATVARLGARQRFIRAGRPNSNGCVERVQLTNPSKSAGAQPSLDH